MKKLDTKKIENLRKRKIEKRKRRLHRRKLAKEHLQSFLLNQKIKKVVKKMALEDENETIP